jgi:nitric oxide reductase NorQ protein
MAEQFSSNNHNRGIIMSLDQNDRRSESGRVQDQTRLEGLIKEIFALNPELTTTQLVQKLGVQVVDPKDLYAVLNHLEASGFIKRMSLSGGKWVSLLPVIGQLPPSAEPSDTRIPRNVIYIDWLGVIPQMLRCYQLKINTLLIGPKSTGKTEAVRRVAELVAQPLEYENFSLRTREHHFIGRLDPNSDGTIGFKPGSLMKSMMDGCVWYGDEINVAEADSLIRLDEATDGRRQLTVEGITYHAKDSWWCVASINPLSHAGTKELPPQLISRFPVRLHFTYPDAENEIQIVRSHCPTLKGSVLLELRKIVEAVQKIRELDLPYTPGLRETVTIGKLLEASISVRDAVEWCLVNVYYQYDDTAAKKVTEFLGSLGIKA